MKCGLVFSVRSPHVAKWHRDPLTGRRVHEECLGTTQVRMTPVVGRAIPRTFPAPQRDEADG